MSLEATQANFNVQIGKLKSQGCLELYIDNLTDSVIIEGYFKYSYAINGLEAEDYIGQVARFKLCNND